MLGLARNVDRPRRVFAQAEAEDRRHVLQEPLVGVAVVRAKPSAFAEQQVEGLLAQRSEEVPGQVSPSPVHTQIAGVRDALPLHLDDEAVSRRDRMVDVDRPHAHPEMLEVHEAAGA